MNKLDIQLNGVIQYIENHIDNTIRTNRPVADDIEAIVRFSGLFDFNENCAVTFKRYIYMSRDNMNVENSTIDLGDIIGESSRELLKKIMSTCPFVKLEHDMIFKYNADIITKTPFFFKYINEYIALTNNEMASIETAIINSERDKERMMETKLLLEDFITSIDK